MAERDRLLLRWSRRKKEAVADEAAAPPPAPKAETKTETEVEPDEPSALPDIASLGRDSDYSAFMRHGVDDVLRKNALRKLWRADPSFSELDGLVEYGEDYTAKGAMGRVVRTAWRFGLGMTDALKADGTDSDNGSEEPSGDDIQAEQNDKAESGRAGSGTV
ncbi:MAG: DUF3306 domain-containing protein [Alphaproteobacteria bacterium]